jgi:CopG family nickel-responsive transcriptional regulator
MSPVDRFTVSLDTELLAAFDHHIAAKGYENRSEAIRDLIRDVLTGTRLQKGGEPVVAFLSMVCDHRVGESAKRIRASVQRGNDLVLGILTSPIDTDRDGLTITLRGPSDRVHAFADELQAMRGVTHGHLSAVPINE